MFCLDGNNVGLGGIKHFENILLNLKVVHCFFSHVLCHEPKSTYKQALLYCSIHLKTNQYKV